MPTGLMGDRADVDFRVFVYVFDRNQDGRMISEIEEGGEKFRRRKLI